MRARAELARDAAARAWRGSGRRWRCGSVLAWHERGLAGRHARETVVELGSAVRDYGGGGENGGARVRAQVNGDVGGGLGQSPGA